jgi:sugar phosphate isomerase/epimerase
MKLGIGSYTFPWAVGLPGANPSKPLTPLQLVAKAHELSVGLVQFGPNMPLDKLPENELREVLKLAAKRKIDLEMGTTGIEPRHLREQIQFAKRIGAILLKTTPERADGNVPTRLEISNCLGGVVADLERGEIPLAIDNSRIPAQELSEILETICSPWVGAALDTANPLALPQGWQFSVRVLGQRTLSVHIKDFVVQPTAHGMGFAFKGAPAGKGQLRIPWMVESFEALRIDPSAILESWTPRQKNTEETIALEEEWARQGVDYLRQFIPD